ncbi:hypothetical protein N431DRAFT_540615 [Stipitochalara longipes BDJ]|nr:hypothetical protein N431DRAFT_540615 [Stipitochalara longipes BDJ]
MAVESRGPLIGAVTWVLTIAALVFLSLRVYCKRIRSRRLWYDDYVLIFAWICLLVVTCCISANISYGFGRHMVDIDRSRLQYVGLLGLISSVFSLLAAIYSKVSFALTLFRLSNFGMRVLLCFIIFSVHIALGGTALISFIQCTPVARNWDYLVEGKCWDKNIFVTYAVAAGSYSGCMDILLALFPWKIVWDLDMKRKEKYGVALAMSMGVFAGAAAITKSVFIPLVATKDFSFDGASLVGWAQAESAICIIASSIPHLRIFLLEQGNSYFPAGSIVDATLTTQPNGSQREIEITCVNQDCAELPARGMMTDNGSGNRSIANCDIEINGVQASQVQLTAFAVGYHGGGDLNNHDSRSDIKIVRGWGVYIEGKACL